MRWLVKSGPQVAFTLFLAVLAVGIIFALLPAFQILTRTVTTTITAATESLSFSLNKGMQSSWVLSPGEFLLESGQPEDWKCVTQQAKKKFIPQQLLCTVLYRTRLVIEGPANVSLEVTPGGEWSVAVIGTGDPAFVVQLFDSNDKKIATFDEEIRFRSTLVEESENQEPPNKFPKSIRIPVIAASAEVGAHVRYATGISDGPSDFWQPTLLAGDVTAFALNLLSKGKYRVQSERLDTGDIIQIDTKLNRPGQKSDDTIWGVATIDKRAVMLSGLTEASQYVISVVLHTTHREIAVRRLGAKDGHTIKASQWTIISRWPNGQQMWVAFVSLMLFLTFALQLADSLSGKRLKTKKKGKKHRNRKRNGD